VAAFIALLAILALTLGIGGARQSERGKDQRNGNQNRT